MNVQTSAKWTSLHLVLAVIASALIAGCDRGDVKTVGPGKSTGNAKLRIGMCPKLIGISYFTACEQGAKEAAGELGLELDYDGPATASTDGQVGFIDKWVAQGYDAIAVAPNDPELVAPALARARAAGVTVLTFDADANPTASGRQTFVNQAPVEGIGRALVDVMAAGIGGKGKVVIITGSLTAPNQNAWMAVMKPYMAQTYPEMELIDTLAGEEDQALAVRLTRDLINSQPDLKGVWGITSVALPGAAKAVHDAGKSGQIYVTGLSLPNVMREYVLEGTVEKFILWNVPDLGYLTIYAARALCEGKLTPGAHTFGRLKDIQVTDGETLLGQPFIFDKGNIGQFDF